MVAFSEMRRSLLVTGLLFWDVALFAHAQLTTPPDSQQQPSSVGCLHGSSESPLDRERRELASAAAWLIHDEALSHGAPVVTKRRMDGSPAEVLPPPPVPRWWLEGSLTEGRLRFYVGPRRETGKAIRWGSEEPLPTWRIEWSLQGPDARGRYRYAFRLIDTRDPCGFSYSSDDLRPFRRGLGVVPVSASRRPSPRSECAAVRGCPRGTRTHRPRTRGWR